MVRTSPIATSIGETLVMTGALTFFFACAGAAVAPANAEAIRSAASAAIMATRRGRGDVRATSSIAVRIGRSGARLERSGHDGQLLGGGAEDLAAVLGDRHEVLD